MVTGIHHISLIVGSEETIDFYKDLGFKVFRTINRSQDKVILMNGLGIGLELFLDARHQRRPNPEPLGLRSISFIVEDIDSTAISLGCDTVNIKLDWFGAKYLNIADPDGNIIQLHEK